MLEEGPEEPEELQPEQPGALGIAFDIGAVTFAAAAGAARRACGLPKPAGHATGMPSAGVPATRGGALGEDAEAAQAAEERGYANAKIKAEPDAEPEAEPEAKVADAQLTARGATLSGESAAFGAPTAVCSSVAVPEVATGAT